jgi:hypothetical protein
MPSPSRRTVVAATLALAIVVAAVALPLFQPWRLVTDTVVDEALPDVGPVSISTSSPAAPTFSGDRSPGASARTTPPGSPDRPAGPERLSHGSFVVRAGLGSAACQWTSSSQRTSSTRPFMLR